MRFLAGLLVVVLALLGFFWSSLGDSSARAGGAAARQPEGSELAPAERGAREGQPQLPVSERQNPEGFVPEVLIEARRPEAPKAEDLGRLRVRVDEGDQGPPKPFVRILLLPIECADDLDLRLLDLAKGSERNGVLTDPVGQASFDVLEGQELVLLAWEEATGHGRREFAIPAFEGGEIRDLRILWDQAEGGELAGLVFDGGTGSPLPGVQVQQMAGSLRLDSSTTTSEGRFSLWSSTPSGSFLRFHAPGYTPRFVDIAHFEELWELGYGVPEEHEFLADMASDEELPTVSLLPNTSLLVKVVGAGGEPGPAGMPVELELQLETWLGDLSKHIDPKMFDASFDGVLDASGQAQFESVPAGVPLRARLKPPLRGASKVLRLASGKPNTVRLTWRPAGLGILRGELTDPAERPLVDQELWLVPSPDPSRYFACQEQVLQSMRTDETGAFRFTNLPPGAYLVGPAARCDPEARSVASVDERAKAVAALGTAVRVEPSKTSLLTLRLDTGVFLKGEVQTADAHLVMDADLTVRAEGLGGEPPAELQGGRFVLGPLVRAPHQLKARQLAAGLSSAWTPSMLDSSAELGTKPQVVRVHPFYGSLSGMVWNSESDAPAEAWLHLAPRNQALFEGDGHKPGPEVVQVVRSQAGTGQFRFENLVPGEYSLIAFLKSRPGLSSVPLIVPIHSENGTLSGLRLSLQQNAEVLIGRGRGARGRPRKGGLEVWSEGSLLRQIELKRAQEVALPPGRLLFSLTSPGGGSLRRSKLLLEPGERRSLFF